VGRKVSEACAPRVQALPPRDGRQERDHGDGRRQPRAGGGRGGLGRLRDHGPALYGGQPGGGPQGGLQGVLQGVRRAGPRPSGSATGSIPRSRWDRA
jgi:hypothetical protein